MATIPRATHLRKLFQTSSTDGSDALKAAVAVYSNFLCQTWKAGWAHASLARNIDKSDPSKSEDICELDRHVAMSYSYILAASERYFEFMRMQKERDTESGKERDGKYYVPTRDISVAWCADLLRRNSSGNDGVAIEDNQDIHGDRWFFHQQHRLLQSGGTYDHITAHRWSIVDALKDGVAWGMATGLVTNNPIAAGGAAAAGAVRGALRKESGVAVTPELRAFDVDDSGIVTAEECDEMLEPWLAQYQETEEDWKKRTMTKYRVDHDVSDHRPARLYSKNCDPVELVADAIKEQSQFVSRVLSLGPSIITDSFVDSAVVKYIKFLHLARNNPDEMLVPTLDVDLVWRAHMLSPVDYRKDTKALCGRVLPHKNDYDRENLEDALENTQRAWFDQYGTHFLENQPEVGNIDDVIICNKYDNGYHDGKKNGKEKDQSKEDERVFGLNALS
mmetsp:Transcript_15701/g.21531  ORF Transcript_15701/g.21531 Transcript_15701/m.21531 type:complete len:448 (-) Transcript_15701:375-1718(-)|eukprot:CAMPEP_0185733010 /NCGR_PEP_ID=MMETSP1171-20130828/18170_1 /TAXON_ID=374046 /ORGANISM="Helicotheca tamensis, Strain CCMP826" /LENGTH=447 /DNA_ID=CAMNT_0028402631 /DNA_START=103 /DNA_END=1446 /DNA_ORIENTATION=-